MIYLYKYFNNYGIGNPIRLAYSILIKILFFFNQSLIETFWRQVRSQLVLKPSLYSLL